MPEVIWIPDPFVISKPGKLTHVDVVTVEQANQLPVIVISRRLTTFHEKAASLLARSEYI